MIYRCSCGKTLVIGETVDIIDQMNIFRLNMFSVIEKMSRIFNNYPVQNTITT